MSLKPILVKPKQNPFLANRLECSFCKKRFSMTSKYMEHMTTHKHFLLSCNICNESFSDKKDLDEHYLTHSGVINTYDCDKCSKKFLQKHELVQHKQSLCTSLNEPPQKKRKSVHFNNVLETMNIDDFPDNEEESSESDEDFTEDYVPYKIFTQTRSGRVVKAKRMFENGIEIKPVFSNKSQESIPKRLITRTWERLVTPTAENVIIKSEIEIEDSNESFDEVNSNKEPEITKHLHIEVKKLPDHVYKECLEKGSVLTHKKDQNRSLNVDQFRSQNSVKSYLSQRPTSVSLWAETIKKNEESKIKEKITSNTNEFSRLGGLNTRSSTKLATGSMRSSISVPKTNILSDVTADIDKIKNSSSNLSSIPKYVYVGTPGSQPNVSKIEEVIREMKTMSKDNIDNKPINISQNSNKNILGQKVVEGITFVKVTPEYMKKMQEKNFQTPKSIVFKSQTEAQSISKEVSMITSSKMSVPVLKDKIKGNKTQEITSVKNENMPSTSGIGISNKIPVNAERKGNQTDATTPLKKVNLPSTSGFSVSHKILTNADTKKSQTQGKTPIKNINIPSTSSDSITCKIPVNRDTKSNETKGIAVENANVPSTSRADRKNNRTKDITPIKNINIPSTSAVSVSNKIPVNTDIDITKELNCKNVSKKVSCTQENMEHIEMDKLSELEALSIMSNNEKLFKRYKAKLEEKERKKREKYEFKKKLRYMTRSLDDSVRKKRGDKDKTLSSKLTQECGTIKNQPKDLNKVCGNEKNKSAEGNRTIKEKDNSIALEKCCIADGVSIESLQNELMHVQTDEEAIEAAKTISLKFDMHLKEEEYLELFNNLDILITRFNIIENCKFLIPVVRFCRLYVENYKVKERAIAFGTKLSKVK